MTHITHNTDLRRFETTIDGITAYLSYKVLDDHTLLYDHTIVPSAVGGRGIGSALTKAALDYAIENQLTIVPSCSFVAHYINKHQEYQTVLK